MTYYNTEYILIYIRAYSSSYGNNIKLLLYKKYLKYKKNSDQLFINYYKIPHYKQVKVVNIINT